MVEHMNAQLDLVFQALADSTRRQMLRTLAAGPITVSELAEPFAMSLAAASKHIKVLERAGLVKREVQGRQHLCHLETAPMHGGMEWLRFYQKFWQERLDKLDILLQKEASDQKSKS